MPFDWNDYYSLALDLRTSPNECCQRSAISRAYYSIYCQARNHLIAAWNVEIRATDSVHSVVWNYYRNKGGATLNAIGVWGSRLRKNRVDADYENEIHRLDDLVDESFRCVDKLLAYLAQIQTPPPS